MNRTSIKLIGLTGGIGSGKSTVRDILSRLGHATLSADEIVHEILDKDTKVIEEIKSKIGKEFATSDNKIDKKKLRTSIQSSAKVKQQLENILHPKVKQVADTKIKELQKKGHKLVIYEIPLLFETKSEKRFDAIICVTADDNIRVERIVNRMKITKKEAQKLIEIQLPQEYKIKHSDFVIENNSNLCDLEQSVKSLAQKI